MRANTSFTLHHPCIHTDSSQHSSYITPAFMLIHPSIHPTSPLHSHWFIPAFILHSPCIHCRSSLHLSCLIHPLLCYLCNMYHPTMFPVLTFNHPCIRRILMHTPWFTPAWTMHHPSAFAIGKHRHSSATASIFIQELCLRLFPIK